MGVFSARNRLTKRKSTEKKDISDSLSLPETLDDGGKYTASVCVMLSLSVLSALYLMIAIHRTLNTGRCNEQRHLCDKDDSLWIPCSATSKDSDPLKTKDDFEVCCTEARPWLINLIHIITTVGQSDNNKELVDNHGDAISEYLSEQLFAHMSLNTIDPKGRIQWEVDCRYSSEQPLYDKGSVTISTPGLYALYGLVTLTSINLNKTGTVKHGMVRETLDNDGQETVSTLLLERMTTLDGPQFAFKPSSLFGQFYLHKGDKVRMFISNEKAVYRFSPTSYWGLYAMKTLDDT